MPMLNQPYPFQATNTALPQDPDQPEAWDQPALQTACMRLHRIAQQAGYAVLKTLAQPQQVRRKADQSPQSKADRVAHALIKTALAAQCPNIPLVSEENQTDPPKAAVFWLVDPIDGTRDLLAGTGEYCINIALIARNRPILGVVYAPSLATSYYGIPGTAAQPGLAFQHPDAGPAERIQVRTWPTDSPLCLLTSRQRPEVLPDSLKEQLPPYQTRVLGSALKFCEIAAGRADLYPRFGPTSYWDTAAPQAILEAAGGHVLALNGQPLDYNLDKGRLNPDFWALNQPLPTYQ